MVHWSNDPEEPERDWLTGLYPEPVDDPADDIAALWRAALLVAALLTVVLLWTD